MLQRPPNPPTPPRSNDGRGRDGNGSGGPDGVSRVSSQGNAKRLLLARRRSTIAVGRRAGRRRLSRRHRALRISLLVLASISLMGIALVAASYFEYQHLKNSLPDVHSLADMEPSLTTHVLASDGKTYLGSLHNSDYEHEHVTVDKVSHWVKSATIDVEDKHFYEHQSADLPRIVKAAWDNVRGTQDAGGASTITEQLAKVSFLSFERSLERKLKQVILGTEIENAYSKDQILEMYLNRISYGNFAVGIQSAALNYFHKTANDLDLSEASLLAGLPNSPTQFNPLVHDATQKINPLAKQRQKVVLDALVASGDITQAQADAAYAKDLSTELHVAGDSEPKTAPSFMSYLREWLQQHLGDQYLTPGGLDIVTTVDLNLQAQGEDALRCGVGGSNGECPAAGKPFPTGDSIYASRNAHDGALVSIDPRNGEVLAMVGAWDQTNPDVGQVNLASAPAQPGSTIKVFTYTAAIASRQFTMKTTVIDQATKFDQGGGPPYAPLNYDRRFHGVCELQSCLGNSFNIPAVKVEAKVGVPPITDLEIASGLSSLSIPDNRPTEKQYAATLGGLKYGISPLELASGVSTLAALGVHREPTPARSIVDRRTGKPVYVNDPKTNGRQVVDPGVAYIVDQMTSNDHNRVTEFGAGSALTLPDRRVSAKTGTTENFVSNWTVGWTPEIATAVMVGNPKPSCLRNEDVAAVQSKGRDPGFPFSPGDLSGLGLQPNSSACGHLEGSTGITGAAPIWHTFMSRATSALPKDWYQKPPGVEQQGAGDDAYFFLTGTSPTTASEVIPCAPALPAAPTVPGQPPAPPQSSVPGAPVCPSPAPPPAPAPTPAPPVPTPEPAPTGLPPCIPYPQCLRTPSPH